MENLNFSMALMLATQSGCRVSRTAWNWQGQFAVVMPSLELPPYSTQDTNRKVNDRTAKHIGEDTPLNSKPYFACYDSRCQEWQPGWIPSQKDLFAEDWYVVQD